MTIDDIVVGRLYTASVEMGLYTLSKPTLRFGNVRANVDVVLALDVCAEIPAVVVLTRQGIGRVFLPEKLCLILQ